MNKLFRLGNGPIAGVCAGIGSYTNMDPVLWRIIFVLGTLFTGFPFILFYIICWIVVPEE
jgi:phage shock protein PspC (stress-responsive transcriptional regulator)